MMAHCIFGWCAVTRSLYLWFPQSVVPSLSRHALQQDFQSSTTNTQDNGPRQALRIRVAVAPFISEDIIENCADKVADILGVPWPGQEEADGTLSVPATVVH